MEMLWNRFKKEKDDVECFNHGTTIILENTKNIIDIMVIFPIDTKIKNQQKNNKNKEKLTTESNYNYQKNEDTNLEFENN